MVASGSTNVASGSEDALGNSITVGLSGPEGELEAELSPLTGMLTPPWFAAFPTSCGLSRGFRSCMCARLGNGLEAPPRPHKQWRKYIPVGDRMQQGRKVLT